MCKEPERLFGTLLIHNTVILLQIALRLAESVEPGQDPGWGGGIEGWVPDFYVEIFDKKSLQLRSKSWGTKGCGGQGSAPGSRPWDPPL